MHRPENTSNVFGDLFEAQCCAAEWQADGCPTGAEVVLSHALAKATERLGLLGSAEDLQFIAKVEYVRTMKELEEF